MHAIKFYYPDCEQIGTQPSLPLIVWNTYSLILKEYQQFDSYIVTCLVKDKSLLKRLKKDKHCLNSSLKHDWYILCRLIICSE